MEVIQVKDQAIEDLEQQLKFQRQQIASKYALTTYIPAKERHNYSIFWLQISYTFVLSKIFKKKKN